LSGFILVVTVEITMSDPIYTLKVGDIPVAVDGSKYGVIVLDVTKYTKTEDVIVRPFDSHYVEKTTDLMDVFRLIYRFRLVGDKIPEWVPHEAKINHRAT
jgi:hypothetical protein